MNVTIPPILFYAMGALLVVFGALRAIDAGPPPRRARARGGHPGAGPASESRHLTFGIVWVAMGLFLIVSTLGVIRMRSPF